MIQVGIPAEAELFKAGEDPTGFIDMYGIDRWKYVMDYARKAIDKLPVGTYNLGSRAMQQVLNGLRNGFK